jgi:glyoxylase-like metal-dependent hydrolase (beta-lactamase superfamily II)
MKYLLLFLIASAGVFAQNTKLKIQHLKGNLYVYTTYNLFSGNPFPSNSMYMVTDDGVVLIDTPWDKNQFQPLLDSIEARHNKIVVLCISTHNHDDRTAGLDYYKSKGIATYSSKFTRERCIENGNPVAEHFFKNDTVFTVGRHKLEAYYPGEGHTPDNITVWFPEEKVLYGGCLVKSVENDGLGNIADANLKVWSNTIQKLINRYEEAAYVVPGHFIWSRGRKALKHTQKLLEKHNRQ